MSLGILIPLFPSHRGTSQLEEQPETGHRRFRDPEECPRQGDCEHPRRSESHPDRSRVHHARRTVANLSSRHGQVARVLDRAPSPDACPTWTRHRHRHSFRQGQDRQGQRRQKVSPACCCVTPRELGPVHSGPDSLVVYRVDRR